MTEKIRILVVIRFPVGGIRTYLKYTYRYLDPKKYDFTFLTVVDSEGEWISKDLAMLHPKIVTVVPESALSGLFFKMIKMLRENRFDLIHSHGFTSGMITALANLPFRVRHMVTSHDVFRPDQFPGWRGKLKKAAMQILMRQIDSIQMVSQDAKDNLLEYFPGLTRISSRIPVIVNGIDIECFRSDQPISSNPLRVQMRLGEQETLFGFLGRFMPQKGFIELILAVEELAADPDLRDRFKILAVNDGAFIREYKSIIESKRLSRYFIFYGFVPETLPILKQIDALLIPSLWEACPLLPMEALMTGTALVASNCIGLREVAKGTPAIQIQAGDPHSLAEGMKKFIANAAGFKNGAADFAAEAVKRFDSRRTAQLLDGQFTGLAAGRFQ